jgi:N6-L-threonylcarbamoyladenine synthase
MAITILAIESSCDDTSVAVVRDGYVLSNLIANQDIHKTYGGVVPELASRAHQVNIVPVTDTALKAQVSKDEINAVAFTRGPGLLGSLWSERHLQRDLPCPSDSLIEVNHLHAHVLAHFILDKRGLQNPGIPFLCLLVSGGHTQDNCDERSSQHGGNREYN